MQKGEGIDVLFILEKDWFFPWSDRPQDTSANTRFEGSIGSEEQSDRTIAADIS